MHKGIKPGGGMKMTDRPIHPKYGPATSAHSRVIEGVTFNAFRKAICNHVFVSQDGRIEVESWRAGVLATADGKGLGRNFRKFETAVRAALKALA